MKLRALVLAGGASERYDGNKLLSAHPAGGTLIEHVLKAVIPLCADTLVVTGRWHEALSEALDNLPVTLSHNAHWQSGMASSIAHGASAIRQHWPDTTHLLICVGDLPALSSVSLTPLIDLAAHSPDTIIASTWQETVGVPAVFPMWYASDLCALEGDRGAGALIHDALRSEPPTAIAVPHAEAAWDIDSQTDW